jgi:hypothetical protein
MKRRRLLFPILVFNALALACAVDLRHVGGVENLY